MDFNNIEDYFTLKYKVEFGDIKRADFNRINGTSYFWLMLLDEFPEEKFNIVLNKFLPDDILVLLASDDDEIIKRHIAMKNRLPEKVLVALSKDNSFFIRNAVLKNKSITKILVEGFLSDPDPEIRNNAKKLIVREFT